MQQLSTSTSQEPADSGADQPQATTETNQEQEHTESSGHQQQTPQQQEPQHQDQSERDSLPVVLIDVPNPEADNAANASAAPQQESTQPPQQESTQPGTEAMDVDNEIVGELFCTIQNVKLGTYD